MQTQAKRTEDNERQRGPHALPTFAIVRSRCQKPANLTLMLNLFA